MEGAVEASVPEDEPLDVAVAAPNVVAVSAAPGCQATSRFMPADYAALRRLVVTVRHCPAARVLASGLEETPPAGWRIEDISHDGVEVGGVIRWGLFLDVAPRELSYAVTPPSGATGPQHFRGVVSLDGQVEEVAGAVAVNVAP